MRNISFFLTTPQFIAGTKDVTRRLGWLHAQKGMLLMAVEKGQGIKKGEKVRRLGPIEILSVAREPLVEIHGYPDDCKREGFPDFAPHEFIEMFCEHNRCEPTSVVTRIEFRKVKVCSRQARKA